MKVAKGLQSLQNDPEEDISHLSSPLHILLYFTSSIFDKQRLIL